MPTVAPSLAERRRAAGLTQADLALLADCSISTIRYLERSRPIRSRAFVRCLSVLNDSSPKRGQSLEAAKTGDQAADHGPGT